MTMTNDEQLRTILRAQEVRPDSDEMKALQEARQDVESLLRSKFASSAPRIRYGGSKAKGTMLLDEFDLDLICYFARDDEAAGKTIKEIYENVNAALRTKYRTDPRTTALRVFDHEHDLHIDVVPGRFIDGKEDYAFLHQNGSDERDWLQTNIDTHIAHVKDSGCVDDVRLGKLWTRKSGLRVRTFPIELLTIKVLKGSGISGADKRFRHLLKTIVENKTAISVEDPANGENDVGSMLKEQWQSLQIAAASTLMTADRSGWAAVFGGDAPVREEARAAALGVSVQRGSSNRPWRDAR